MSYAKSVPSTTSPGPVIALAWLMKHPSGIIPIIGSRNPENIRVSVRADNVELSREQWYRIRLCGTRHRTTMTREVNR